MNDPYRNTGFFAGGRGKGFSKKNFGRNKPLFTYCNLNLSVKPTTPSFSLVARPGRRCVLGLSGKGKVSAMRDLSRQRPEQNTRLTRKFVMPGAFSPASDDFEGLREVHRRTFYFRSVAEKHTVFEIMRPPQG